MPISAARLMAMRPPAEEEQNQFVELARLMRERFSKQFAGIANAATSAVVSSAKVGFEPHYLPPPLPASPPVQRQRIHIVIDLILDLPPQG